MNISIFVRVPSGRDGLFRLTKVSNPYSNAPTMAFSLSPRELCGSFTRPMSHPLTIQRPRAHVAQHRYHNVPRLVHLESMTGDRLRASLIATSPLPTTTSRS